MTDYRAKLINDIETLLINNIEADNVHIISNGITKLLNDYEVIRKCTDIVPLDSINTKLLKRYSACLMVDGKANSTIKQYMRTLNILSNFLNKPFTEMGVYDIRYFLACEEERGIAKRTLDTNRATISAFFRWLTDEEIIAKNPISNLKKIKYANKLRSSFSDVEIDQMRSNCKSHKERALVEFLLATGVRIAELSHLEISDINFSELSVHVKHGKGNKERMTYITPIAASYLKRYLDNRPESGDALFYNCTHGILRPCGARFILKELEKRSGVSNIHPHRFRRTFATSAARHGCTIQEIQRLLGHSNINTTMQYVCVDDDRVKDSYRRYIN